MKVQRIWAGIIGIGFMVVGILRFILLESLAGWESPEPIHGALHLITGVAFFWSAWTKQGRYAQLMNRWNGLFWLLIGIVGNLGLLEGIEALAFDDNAVHLIVGVISVVVGWAGSALAMVKKRSVSAS